MYQPPFWIYSRRHLLFWSVSIVLFAGISACGADYDTVIQGGRVMDPESGLDSVVNIGILEGQVRAISGDNLDGSRVIDATGLIVAPGFVDLHRHGQSERAYRLQVQDGVTTGLELEIGTPNAATWYAEREGGQLVNYGVSIGHIGVRARAMGDSVLGSGGITARQQSSPDQISETEQLIREGLAQGAIGVGFGTAYTPGATMDEIEHMFSVAADLGVTAFVHMRGGLEGLDSTLTAANNAAASLHIVHANSSGGGNILEFLEMIQMAQDEGRDVTTEAYPYGASQTGIQSALFDDWESWDDERFERHQWVRTGERLNRETFSKYREEGGSVIIHGRTEEMTLAAVTSPLTIVASDGGTGHPRGAGTFARILGRYVREQGALELMDALARMTILPTLRLEEFVPAMKTKGRIRVGSDADITIFDPETVIDRATYLEGSLTSDGIEYVLVNGIPVVYEGEIAEGVRPGKAIKAEMN
ncbi:MAG: D-glutamate deacylase [Gemmatimonadota bacterium]|jgi:dihydroorotase|nr:MAG: D-glutamate deacylase [Gemmatimonadota bacterium]|tara:strand:+ start:933 stop:2357 length:1425 start_codon:yes stop_codon:yes gene_type:complete